VVCLNAAGVEEGRRVGKGGREGEGKSLSLARFADALKSTLIEE
jgi:hypothetical protein